MRRFIVAAVVIVTTSTSIGQIRRRRSTMVRSWKDHRARLLHWRILHNFLEPGHKNGSGFHSSRLDANWMRRMGKYRRMLGSAPVKHLSYVVSQLFQCCVHMSSPTSCFPPDDDIIDISV
jgi:hypothetical protein